MAFDSSDPSTWGIDFGRTLSPEEVAYYAPTMQQNYERNQAMASVFANNGLDGSQWTDIYTPGGAVYGATSATPYGNQGSYNTTPNTGAISAGPSDQTGGALNQGVYNTTPNTGAISAGLSDQIGGALNQVAANGVQPVVRSATNTVASPLNMLAVNSFGSGAGHGYSDTSQLANIRAAWNDYLAGKRSANSVYGDMTQYGVNYQDLADATGLSVADVVARLAQPQASYGSGQTPINPVQQPGAQGGQRITPYPTYTPDTQRFLPAPTPYTYQSAQGPVASYFPSSYWTNAKDAYGGLTPAKFAEGGAVTYNPARVDEIYNQLKGL